MKSGAATILPFACSSSSADWQSQRKKLLGILRFSTPPVILDLSRCTKLSHNDIGFFLDCLALATGRDTNILLVAGSQTNRVLLNVTRISSLVPVFDSVTEALADPMITKEIGFGDQRENVRQGGHE